MAKLLQVGLGSGGMPVLDALARDPRITYVALFDPDIYQENELQRHVNKPPSAPAPAYPAPRHDVVEARIPASKAAISAVAGLHALVTLDVLENIDPGFTTMLFSLKKVDGVFADAYRPHRFVVP